MTLSLTGTFIKETKMTVIAYTDTFQQVAGYFEIGLDGVRLGVTQTHFVAKMVGEDLVSLGIPYPRLNYFRCIWMAEMTFNSIFPNTSKLRSSVQKFTLGYWEIDYWGAISSSGYLQYLSQRCPTQICRVTEDAYVYPALPFPTVVGQAYQVHPLNPEFLPEQTGTTFHFLLDQVNPIGSRLQISYQCYGDGYEETPPLYYGYF